MEEGNGSGENIFYTFPTENFPLEFQIVESWPDVPPYFPPTKNITFSQFYSNPSELYSSIEILLVPSLWEEGVPCVISEALFNKIPVIAHDIGGIKEAGSEYILYVNPPTIQGHFLKETIIYPQIESAEETRVAKDFCEKILWIDTHPQEKQRLADGGYDFTKSLENNARKEILRIFN